MKELDENYWTSRWNSADTGWDAGSVTTPLKIYFDNLTDQNSEILIPGCGSGYEGTYLWQRGFRNLYMLDISLPPLEKFRLNNPDFPLDHLIHDDFFNLDRQFDLVIEQTFFCALNPGLREAYVRKMSELIRKGGRLAGLLFGVMFEKEGPPFGGEESEYRKLFAPYFEINTMEICETSIGPRLGNELFFEMTRK